MKRNFFDWGGNVLALAIVITVNALANIVPIAGTTTGEVANKYFSLFTPAGFAFSIWGLIYFVLALFVIYQALPAQRQNEPLARIGMPFKVSCAANALWLFTWHLEWLVPALMLMIVLLVALIVIYRSLDIVATGARASERWLVQLPFGLYLGWISVATIANLSAVQSALYWNDLGFDAVTWTLIKLAIAAAIACIVSLRRHDLVFPLAVAWAAFGIAAGQAATPAVAGAAGTVMILTTLIAAFEALRRFRFDR
jgi:benzodiazapine receptor